MTPPLKEAVKPVIAVVGLSVKADRASYQVSLFMQRAGFRIVPVNPRHAGEMIIDELCYATLADAAQILASVGERITIVNVFRRSEEVVPVAHEAVAIAADCLWLQLGIRNEVAAGIARDAGMLYIEDRCIKVEYATGRSHGILF